MRHGPLVLFATTLAIGAGDAWATPPSPELPSGTSRPNLYVTPGVLYSSTSGGAGETSGVGGEVALVYYPRLAARGDDLALGVGPLLQLQAYDHGARFAAGGQVNYRFFGLELAYARRDAHEGVPATHMVQVTPFVSLAIAYLGLRVAQPFADHGSGAEVGITVGAKLPIRLMGDGSIFF